MRRFSANPAAITVTLRKGVSPTQPSHKPSHKPSHNRHTNTVTAGSPWSGACHARLQSVYYRLERTTAQLAAGALLKDL
eukprot:CAMPEP_0174748068 /NCGR_PEP_ID=MMETSP1094-20130205/92636_1 /TAXON_ID=156173 /ORGANISM="Chrysochromulina brevifilum, Strain UTEX LB 985" /LENGTH=78 /DNA_ID=CAMNT_0015953047 /DNA_START=25 /DNA_END=258 /DNA_ORIENTATION=+